MQCNLLGWNSFFAQSFECFREQNLENFRTLNYTAARIASVHKNTYSVYRAHNAAVQTLTAEISGQLRHRSLHAVDLPTVGDWVVITACDAAQRAIIHHVLPRQTQFIRKAAGTKTEAQLMAANVDTVFLVSGLDQDFNPRRIERYLLLAWESGARPVIVLNKADLCSDIDRCLSAVESVASGLPVVVLSALNQQGLATLEPYLQPGQTIALLGSSGVGKSTLANQLLGTAMQPTQSVRQKDDRGRHTTTHRSLFVLLTGALLIDTPGMRELQIWTGEDSLQNTFTDIEALAQQCRFHDCRHRQEPGCAVQAAIETGTLEPDRLLSYQKLSRELSYLDRKQDQSAQQEEKRRWRQISKALRHHSKSDR